MLWYQASQRPGWSLPPIPKPSISRFLLSALTHYAMCLLHKRIADRSAIPYRPSSGPSLSSSGTLPVYGPGHTYSFVPPLL